MSAIRNRDKIERRITDIVDELVEAMALGWLEVQLRFDEGPGANFMASASCDWQYRRIVIVWSIPDVAKCPDAELQLTAIHELCHALIEPLWDSHPGKEKAHVVKLGELVTENVARVVQSLLNEREQ